MTTEQAILSWGDEHPAFTDGNLLFQNKKQIPGSVQYDIRRYKANFPLAVQDTGMIMYHFQPTRPKQQFLELRYCISGNRYCPDKNCSQCVQIPTEGCLGKQATLDLFTFHFSADFLGQFIQNVKLSGTRDEVLAFRHPESFTQIFPLSARKRIVLDQLLNHSYSGSLENIYVNARIHELLLYALAFLEPEKEEIFACKFLADEQGRERIQMARDILLEHIGDPITIKDLSRKVAMNECYVKKGFKEVFGTTIFDYYQQQRMEHAKYLLYEKGFSVTDVSAQLGYSSISHFSAAFKKHTGIKPCELLQ
ncbi:MAG: AraC family transcriptional regulator [Chitinophagia bacterium]